NCWYEGVVGEVSGASEMRRVHPEGAQCTASLAQAVLAVCLPVRGSTTRRAAPSRLLLTERKSRAFVSGRTIALAAGGGLAASLGCRQSRRPVDHGTREETWR